MKLKLTIITLVVLIGVTFGVIGTAKANRSYFVPTVQTDIATTSPNYMRVSNEVEVFDAYSSAPFAVNSATLLVQSVASTSAAVQTITIQYSQDGIDWYQDNLSTTTSSSVIALNNTQRTYTITGNATASTTRLAISVPTPTRFVRATVATSTALSSVWLQWVPLREAIQ